MARSLSWIDNDELSALFEVVGPRKSDEPEPTEWPGPKSLRDPWPDTGKRRTRADARDATWSGVLPRKSAPQSAARPRRRPAPARASHTPAAPAPAPAPVAQAPAPVPVAPAPAPAAPAIKPFAPGANVPMAARMEKYFDWLLDQAPVRGAVIADSQGLIVAKRHAGAVEAALAHSLEQLFSRVRSLFADEAVDSADTDVSGHVVLRHKDRLLIAIWIPTDFGRYYGVLIGDEVPGVEVMEFAERGLEFVFAS